MKNSVLVVPIVLSVFCIQVSSCDSKQPNRKESGVEQVPEATNERKSSKIEVAEDSKKKSDLMKGVSEGATSSKWCRFENGKLKCCIGNVWQDLYLETDKCKSMKEEASSLVKKQDNGWCNSKEHLWWSGNGKTITAPYNYDREFIPLLYQKWHIVFGGTVLRFSGIKGNGEKSRCREDDKNTCYAEVRIEKILLDRGLVKCRKADSTPGQPDCEPRKYCGEKEARLTGAFGLQKGDKIVAFVTASDNRFQIVPYSEKDNRRLPAIVKIEGWQDPFWRSLVELIESKTPLELFRNEDTLSVWSTYGDIAAKCYSHGLLWKDCSEEYLKKIPNMDCGI